MGETRERGTGRKWIIVRWTSGAPLGNENARYDARVAEETHRLQDARAF